MATLFAGRLIPVLRDCAELDCHHFTGLLGAGLRLGPIRIPLL
jgi:hypothetical protein